MPTAVRPPTTDIAANDMTGEQLALPTSQKVSAITKHGKVTGGRVKNGAQVFLNVPYGVDVPRWSDPQPLPEDYKYPDTPFTVDGKYCAQPERTYKQTNTIRERLGLGQPTENPFFADIYIPSDYALSSPGEQPLRPVRVFIHGGFLQYGSTSGNYYNQQFFSAEHYNEVRVLLGHRVSVLGFLGVDEPAVSGNFGFKDCWLGLEWVKKNIAAFGGDPSQIHLSGLSGGAHVVHQLIHQAARLAPSPAPFITAHLQSNAILADPLTPAVRKVQFEAFCQALGVDATTPNMLDELRDTAKYPTAKITKAVQDMGELCTFRGVVGSDGWVRADEMEFQQSGGLARGLRDAGVKCIVAGDVRDEDSFYRGVHPSKVYDELVPNIARYYPYEQSQRFLDSYPPIPRDSTPQQLDDRLGRVLADGQVHLPVRLLTKDLTAHSFPAVRYAIEFVPVSQGPKVSHGTDLAVHHLRLSVMEPEEVKAALTFNKILWEDVDKAVKGNGWKEKAEEEMLVLSKGGETEWKADWRWPLLKAAEKVFRP
ncbi:hypothetical protein L198_05811 [Cryptococcus wingfieldii CBS 7118]|uniref:Carboxylic ester hydrolase n=1 Tax=Cryptococcus wingfieldii CBS 7118 TaxID=1295528 RepID=A0A1E3IUA8_9TREE|nr:hypothetical protein L198_05811 [Cryptococcus wingfieldii CBS 7118]ODN92138.1 hypothetical protein L198_05811 [Cryptococcus wingfieldii CBS 7118]